MSSNVVIVIPTQGHSTSAFDAVAAQLKSEIYAHAVIVKTKVSDAAGVVSVEFFNQAHPFLWDRTDGLTRVVTISHGMMDGPNLAFCDPDLPDEAHQPWGTNNGDLTPLGSDFWTRVGQHMTTNGKIILLGCLMGAGSFALNVAKLTKRSVYAATNEIAAGNAKASLSRMHAVEHGKTPAGMQLFTG